MGFYNFKRVKRCAPYGEVDDDNTLKRYAISGIEGGWMVGIAKRYAAGLRHRRTPR